MKKLSVSEHFLYFHFRKSTFFKKEFPPINNRTI